MPVFYPTIDKARAHNDNTFRRLTSGRAQSCADSEHRSFLKDIEVQSIAERSVLDFFIGRVFVGGARSGNKFVREQVLWGADGRGPTIGSSGGGRTCL